MFALRTVRDALAHDEPQLAASEAVLVGALAAEAEAKFRWGDVLLRQARATKNRELSRRSAAVRQKAAVDRDREIAVESLAYRKKHPTHSTRCLANWIARELEIRVGTVRDRLRKRGIR